MTVLESNRPEETFSFGEQMAKGVRPGRVYALFGDLGAGKTEFAKGFAKGLGVLEPVTSPTFTILQVYEGGTLPFYHFDLYRLEEPEEFEAIGGGEYFDGDGVCLVEWADRMTEILPPDAVRIRIERDNTRGTDYRRLSVEGEE